MQHLNPGEIATLEIATHSGGTPTYHATVPKTLDGERVSSEEPV